MLLLISLGVMVGSFMPWIETGFGSLGAFAGPGQYTFYAAFLGMGAGLVPIRILAIGQGAIMAGAAIILPIWQAWHLWSQVGFQGWVPGIGMMLVLGCGLMSARIVWSFVQEGQG